MKKFRGFLVLLLAICLCAGIGFASDIVSAAQTRATLEPRIIAPGHAALWYPYDNDSGILLTNGGRQAIYIKLGELHNRLETGFMQYTTRDRYVWFSGQVNPDIFNFEDVLYGPTGYYMPYLANFNQNVYIRVLTGSYVMYQ